MLISVILTTFKRPELLARAIRSVIEQKLTAGDELELIVSDDDPTGSGLKGLSAIEPGLPEHVSLKYIKRGNEISGVAASRNRSMAVASGEWIAFLDDDDMLMEGALAGLLDRAQATRADFCAGHYVIAHETGDGQTTRETVVEPTWDGHDALLLSNRFPVGSFVVRREKIRIPFNTNLRTLEDWLFLIDNLRDLRVEMLPQTVLQVRQVVDATREHRNQSGGYRQRAADFARIYSLVPSAELAAKRQVILASLGGTELDQLLTDGADTPEPAADIDGSYQRWIKNHALQEIDGEILAERLASKWTSKPRFHFVMPLTPGAEALLADTIDALTGQLYGAWHLTVISERPSPDPIFETLAVLSWQQVPAADTGAAVAQALVSDKGDWAAIIAAGTRLPPQALAVCGSYVNLHPEWKFIYTDEDTILPDGERKAPQFKPDFNLDLLRSTYYLGSLCLVEHATLEALETPFQFTAAAHYDMALRVLDLAGEQAIGHIADVLCHVPEDTPSFAEENAGALAVAAHLERRRVRARVVAGYLPQTYRVVYEHEATPRVAIIIPNKDRVEFLEPCVESLLGRTDYPNLEILIVDNQSSDPDLFSYYDRLLAAHPSRIRVLYYPHEFNYSAMCNLGVRETTAEYVLFLNNDTQALHPEWLTRMMAHAQRPEVGIVGARLIYPETGKLQHAGVVLGMAECAGHVFGLALDLKSPGYLNRAQVEQDYSAVTGACQLVRTELFYQVGGFDEEDLKVLYSDIDLCLKIGQAGYKVVWTPFATLAHHESVSLVSTSPDLEKLGRDAARKKRESAVFKARWLSIIANDPAFNPNLSLRHAEMRPDGIVPRNWDVNFRDRMRVLGIPLSGGSGHYRLTQPFGALSQSGLAQAEVAPLYQGHGVLTSVELARLAPDVFVVHAALNDVELNALEEYRALLPGLRIVFLLDDLISQVPEKSSVYRTFMAGFRDARRRLRRALKSCDRFIASTPFLAESLASSMEADVKIIPNRLSRDPWATLSSRRRGGPRPRVGWAGAQQHLGDLEILLPVLQALHREVDFVFMGMCPDSLRPYVAEFHDFVAIDAYPAKLAALDLDLALAPLEDIPFNKAKSNLRLLEYGILGWPVICSDIEPYRLYDAPVTRVPNEAEHWIGAIRGKLADPVVLAGEGSTLREWVRKHFILEDHLDEWADGLLKY